MFRYRVQTVCPATIHEVWTLQSREALTEAEVHQALEQGLLAGATNGSDRIVLACEEETRVEEGARQVVRAVRVRTES